MGLAKQHKRLKWENVDKEELAIMLAEEGDNEMYERMKKLKQHSINLWMYDAATLIVEHLQYYAMLLSLSERWGWPLSWVTATCFAYIFNIDLWEFKKITSGAFNHSRSSFIDSTTVGFNYSVYLIMWFVILVLTAVAFAGIYVKWLRRRPLYMLLYIARWKRTLFLLVQFLTMPFGIAVARLFHCRLSDTKDRYILDMRNEIECESSLHMFYIVVFGVIALFWFFVYPLWLRSTITDQVLSADTRSHEGYLQLKESEYEQGLDIAWEINQYHLFSSFRRPWVCYNPYKFLFKFMLIASFALSTASVFWSSAALTILFFVATLVMICRRPYRVKSFSFILIVSHLMLSLNALFGNFTVRPPWEEAEKFQIVSFLRYPTIYHILLVVNLSWVGILGLWLLCLLFLSTGLIVNGKIWPRLKYASIVGDDTKKYLKAAVCARQVLENTLVSVPLFAPVHELVHQVKVINAYCRETEYLKDPTHDTLWDLLDELIAAHNALAPVSVFGMSQKASIRETSEEFVRLMPSFRRRLKQREYDFILIPPVKRRLLLKMYILGVFVSNIRKNRQTNIEKLDDAFFMFDGQSVSGLTIHSPSLSSRPISAMTLNSRAATKNSVGSSRVASATIAMKPLVEDFQEESDLPSSVTTAT